MPVTTKQATGEQFPWIHGNERTVDDGRGNQVLAERTAEWEEAIITASQPGLQERFLVALIDSTTGEEVMRGVEAPSVNEAVHVAKKATGFTISGRVWTSPRAAAKAGLAWPWSDQQGMAVAGRTSGERA